MRGKFPQLCLVLIFAITIAATLSKCVNPQMAKLSRQHR